MGAKEKKIKRTLWLRTGDGELRITIPAGARVTFGPTVPYATKGTPGYGADRQLGYSLRVYANLQASSLMALFSDVYWFRDLQVVVRKLKERDAEGRERWVLMKGGKGR